LRLVVGDEVVIEVRNARGAADRPGGGRGVDGMRERVRLLGGRIEAGPDGADWRLAAAFPRSGAE
jgi:signal transduction histidine kinase